MKTIYLTDQFASFCADPDGIACFLTGEKTHYFDMYHDQEGNPLYVSLDHSEKILRAVEERKDHLSDSLELTIAEVSFQVIDTRPYKVFYSTYDHPDYQETGLEDDERWLSILPIEWHEANDNDQGIETIALKREHVGRWGGHRIVGYNGILNGEKVEYKGKLFTVVMVSRLGDFGLSTTGELPYIKRVSPLEVKKLTA